MVAAHGSVVAHPHRILYFERDVCDREYYFRRCGTVRTQGLSPHIWITTQRLHAAEMLGVCAYNIFYFIILIIKLDSRVWHQMLRRNLTSHANFLANTLHLPRGTFTTYFKLFTTFLISGLLHAIGEHVFFQNFLEGATIQFFLLQAVGITFEDAAIGLASRLGYRESNTFKLIGFMWVFAWFTFCMPMWLDSQVYSESGKMYQENFSLVQVLKSFCSSHGIFKMAT
jgi:hypothetical protein